MCKEVEATQPTSRAAALQLSAAATVKTTQQRTRKFGSRAPPVQLLPPPASGPIQRQRRAHRGTSLSLGSPRQAPRSQVKSHAFNSDSGKVI